MRLVGINIPDNKRIEIALTYIYGIGRASAVQILESTGIDENKKAKDLSPGEINKIKEFIEKRQKIEGELRQIIRSNIKRLKEIHCYRGLRHERKLPARGQRTKTNSRTVRGNVRKTVGSGRRKTELK
ncbi:MAG: 30S ribosomal protein S13 [Candidatus Wolfebacteria bacterium GW2011_GWA2_42_10]|uniref:Small ribosomal subunit protein uS13 n=2 Tax=Candidatus Wolfeibacteriota TaxID=1752735 RepID=A0A0G0XL49_9BACT|nr:MAG: 30S ribosomal protein S13 [Candidatus Wolfebacteria bacterium GW2011_GWB1_41_12]KKS25604.1 MAG: 30S ribosomal protein S13 [Candidatus Wolfebacteria bacterium GW2011_GWA2_42_10]KKT56505.1 MAG: 30S ribosomal protein S13 [Candidatus Wolfebacteria bacterium GW2011_GWA1_44_24]